MIMSCYRFPCNEIDEMDYRTDLFPGRDWSNRVRACDGTDRMHKSDYCSTAERQPHGPTSKCPAAPVSV